MAEFHGTLHINGVASPYTISADRRHGTVTVRDPKDGSSHTVVASRDLRSGRITLQSIDGYSMWMVNNLASAEQRQGVATLERSLHAAEGQITRDLAKADGLADPESEARRREQERQARETREREARERQAAELQQRREQTPPVETPRDRDTAHPEPQHPPHDAEAPSSPLATRVPLPRRRPAAADRRETAVVRHPQPRVAHDDATRTRPPIAPHKSFRQQQAVRAERYPAQQTVTFGHGDTTGSLRFKRFENGRLMVYRDAHTTLREMVSGPKRAAALEALRARLEHADAPQERRALRYMANVVNHLAVPARTTTHTERPEIADPAPGRLPPARREARPTYRTALLSPIDGVLPTDGAPNPARQPPVHPSRRGPSMGA